MKQSESIKYYVDQHTKFHNLKIFVNNRINTFRVSRKLKMIEYNSRFWNTLTINQETYLLIWSRKFYKTKSEYKADKLALASYEALRLPVEDITDLYKRPIFHSNKVRYDRMFHLATVSQTEYFFIELKQKIINFFKQWKKQK